MLLINSFYLYLCVTLKPNLQLIRKIKTDILILCFLVYILIKYVGSVSIKLSTMKLTPSELKETYQTNATSGVKLFRFVKGSST